MLDYPADDQVRGYEIKEGRETMKRFPAFKKSVRYERGAGRVPG